MAWQTYACLFHLNEVAKSNRLDKKDVREIREACLFQEIRQDNKRMLVFVPLSESNCI